MGIEAQKRHPNFVNEGVWLLQVTPEREQRSVEYQAQKTNFIHFCNHLNNSSDFHLILNKRWYISALQTRRRFQKILSHLRHKFINQNFFNKLIFIDHYNQGYSGSKES